MTEIKKESGGFVRISDAVLSRIAQAAAMEAEGVLRIVRKTGGKSIRKNLVKCTKVSVKGRVVGIGMLIAVGFGAKVHDVSADVQQRVKTAIETMTGLTVAQVNVTVGAIVEPT